jgi:hypothetical protein
MKKLMFTVLALVGMFGAMAQKTVVADANAVPRTLNGSFTTIKVSGGIDLYLSQAETESAAVSAAEPQYRDNIKTEVENGILRIYYDGNKVLNWKNKYLKVYVSFRKLEKLIASGASAVQVTGAIESPSLVLNCSGASTVKTVIKTDELKIDLSGASDAKLSGSAATVIIESSGASDVKAYELFADVCSAKASGASSIKITVNKEINVHASGASSIQFKGDAVIKDIHSSGASSVSRKS